MDDARVLTVWDWCSEAYLRHGRKLTFPKNTIPNETYQWRFIKAIALKFNDWKFNDDTAKVFINIAVSHAKQHGLLQKGLSILHQNNMMDICYKKLQDELKNGQQTTLTLQNMKYWFDEQIKSQTTKKPIDILLDRANQRACCNLAIWHQATKISISFISLSKICNKALDCLPEFERRMFPKPTELYLIRSKALKDNFIQIKEIFKGDLIKSCLLPL